MKIALDGPAGAGKSTIAKAIAKELDIMYLDTGAMYRAVGLYMSEHNIPAESDKVREEIENTKLCVKYIDGTQHIFLGNEDVSKKIRENHVSALASQYSALKPVREFLVRMQQETARTTDCVLDGRDIGTCVLPDADFKFFLTADSLERAKRRAKELEEKGEKVDLMQLKKEIEQRDYDDSHREFSPLKKADDAIVVDSTSMSIEEVKNYIIGIIKEGK